MARVGGGYPAVHKRRTNRNETIVYEISETEQFFHEPIIYCHLTRQLTPEW